MFRAAVLGHAELFRCQVGDGSIGFFVCLHEVSFERFGVEFVGKLELTPCVLIQPVTTLALI